MQHFFRIRAFVDSSKEEHICSGLTTNDALADFSQITDDNGNKFETYGIDIAMVHKISFGEAGPVFEDVTHEVDGSIWARAEFEKCMLFFDQPKA